MRIPGVGPNVMLPCANQQKLRDKKKKPGFPPVSCEQIKTAAYC